MKSPNASHEDAPGNYEDAPGNTETVRDLRPGSRTQGLLLTLLGDYWYGQPTYIPSAALVDLLAEFGVSSQAARAGLSRISRLGALEGTRQGRRTAYRVQQAGAKRARDRRREIIEFTRTTPDTMAGWSGTWTLATYSLPADHTDERRRIRRRLRALGFGPLQDAVWICPYPRAEQVQVALAELVSPGQFTVLEHATIAAGSSIDPVVVWSLDELADRYRAALDEFDELARRAEDGDPSAALVARTEAMDEWRIISRIDPVLPPELVPGDWPGWSARHRFTAIYDGLGDLAEQRVREVVGRHSPEAADAVRHHTVADPPD